MTREIRGRFDAENSHIAIVVSRFNELITDRLMKGALGALERHGVSKITVVHVPGAFEIPLSCRWLVEKDDVDGVVALGVVIQGQTPHFDYVCSQAAAGVMNAMTGSGKPIGFGVLTCDSMEQALDRAGGKVGNKGAEATEAMLEMLGVRDALA